MGSFLKKFKEIYDGWKNDAFPTPDVLVWSEPRAKICADCPLNVNNVCSTFEKGIAVKEFIYQEEIRYQGREYKGCGCPLSKKTKSLDSKCPIGRW